MSNELKDIHFQVPIELYEMFYRMFPERGATKAFLTQCMKQAIAMRASQHTFSKEVVHKVLEGLQYETFS